MNPEVLFSPEDVRTLRQARSTYGPRNQIAVAAEECIELAKELLKALRYEDFDSAVQSTGDKVTEEVADVLIVLDHVLNLYAISTDDLRYFTAVKMDRLRKWLDNSESIEFTTKERSLDSCDEIIENLTATWKGRYENDKIILYETGDQKYKEMME